MSPLVTLDQATFRFSETGTLGPISWQIESGQKWFIAGRNGSGKSVLLGLIEGGGRIQSGQARGIPQNAVVVSAAVVAVAAATCASAVAASAVVTLVLVAMVASKVAVGIVVVVAASAVAASSF